MKLPALHWQILGAMVLGAGIGLTLNATLGYRATDQPIEFLGGQLHVRGMAEPVRVPPANLWISDSPKRTMIQIEPTGEDAPSGRRILVSSDVEQYRVPKTFNELPWPPLPLGIQPPPIVVPTVKQLKTKDPAAYVLFHRHGRSSARVVGDLAQSLGDLFLRMLMMVSIPLIVTSLVTGITGLGKAERLGRMFSRTILYYLATSLLAIVTGLLVFNAINPGGQAVANQADEAADERGVDEQKGLATVLFEQIESMIPTNPFAALVQANFLSVIAFSLVFGVCVILVGGRTAEHIGGLFESAFQVMMRMTMIIVQLAPFGVFFLMLAATSAQGITLFGTLGTYMATVACALAIHALIVLPLILWLIAKRNPWQFAKAMSPALVTAFSSASSNGTLPLTMNCVEKRAGASNRVASFVLPLGATVNMDGTALYEVIAVMFIANLTPGVDLTLSDQIIVAYTALLASIGAAGIPHAGLVMMVIVLHAVGLPTEKQGIIIAVDRILDMCRTTVNVWSDSCGCAVISRFEASGAKADEAPQEESVNI